MKYYLLCVSLIYFASIDASFGESPISLTSDLHITGSSDSQVLYLLSDKNDSFSDVRNGVFKKSSNSPGISKRRQDKAVWMKFTCSSVQEESYIIDFIRKDFIDVFVLKDDVLTDHYVTGYALKASQKAMGRWNTVNFDMREGEVKTFYVKLVNETNEPNLEFDIMTTTTWRSKFVYKLIGDISFLAILLVVAIHAVLVYSQSRMKSFLYFGAYLFLIFIFYAFITRIMKDYMLPELPSLTQHAITVAFIVPYFYYGFAKEFINLPLHVPKLNYLFQLLVKSNLVIMVVDVCYYLISGDYYLFTDVIRITMSLNVLLCTGIVIGIYRKKSPFANYFALGSAAMLVGVLIDLVLWRSYESSLGAFARIGFIVEMLCFSAGLGKKAQIVALEKRSAQRSYIEQLEINERLIQDQKGELERKVNERTSQLQIAKEKAERNAKVREEFLSVMSHEIRTPMNAIVGMTHLISEANSESERNKNLETLRFSVDNLLHLVNDILDFRKIDSGELKIAQKAFDLEHMVEELVHLYDSEADKKDIDFSLAFDGKIQKHLMGDEYRLSQILGNLLSNAIKFTHRGAVRLKVSLHDTETDFESISFEVEDTGIGISPDQQKKIFKDFNQAGLAFTRRYGTTGLGLAITKNLVNMMGGVIRLKSEVGKGSSFGFTIKLRKNKDTSVEQMPVGKNIPDEDIKGLKCLIVDDNKLNRIVLTKFLQKWEVTSDNVASGKEALIFLQEKKYDLVLLDLQMPEMDGYEVAQKIREMDEFHDLPIVAITADAVSNIKDKVKVSGMNDYVTKPFNPDDLKARIYKQCTTQKVISK